MGPWKSPVGASGTGVSPGTSAQLSLRTKFNLGQWTRQSCTISEDRSERHSDTDVRVQSSFPEEIPSFHQTQSRITMRGSSRERGFRAALAVISG